MSCILETRARLLSSLLSLHNFYFFVTQGQNSVTQPITREEAMSEIKIYQLGAGGSCL
jgi:hypothetical protein